VTTSIGGYANIVPNTGATGNIEFGFPRRLALLVRSDRGSKNEKHGFDQKSTDQNRGWMQCDLGSWLAAEVRSEIAITSYARTTYNEVTCTIPFRGSRIRAGVI